MAFIITIINVSLELTMAFNIASSFADIKIPKKYIFPYVLMASIIDSLTVSHLQNIHIINAPFWFSNHFQILQYWENMR